MKEKLIPLTIMLTAGAVTGILCIWKHYDTLYSLKALLAVLIGFYLLGLFVKKLFRKVCAEPAPEEKDQESEQEKEQSSGEDGKQEKEQAGQGR